MENQTEKEADNQGRRILSLPRKNFMANREEEVNYSAQGVAETSSEQPQSEVFESVAEPAENPKKSGGYKKVLIFSVIVIGIFSLLGGGVFGYYIYEKNLRTVSLESLLPNDPGLVVKVNLKFGTEQYQLVQEHLNKFPGYAMLLKELDETGQGRTLEQHLSDSLKENGIDFEQDVKPLLPDNAYLVIKDLQPLSEELEKTLSSGNQKLRFLGDLFNRQERQEIAGSNESGADGTRVLGQTSDMYLTEDTEEADFDLEKFGFVFGFQIKDLEKAEEVMKKSKENSKEQDKSGEEMLSYQGYDYLKLTDKDEQGKESATYTALVGDNMIFTLREKDIKAAIDQRKKQEMLTGFFSKEVPVSLETDDNFKTVMSQVENSGQEKLFSVYYNFNMNKLLGNTAADQPCDPAGGGCGGVEGMIKYPEQLRGGVTVRVDQQGVIVNTASNQISLDSLANIPAGNSLANKLPIRADERWADIFIEYNNPRDLYYNFKKNNLTAQGMQTWKEALDSLETEIGLNLERDFIDQFESNVGAVLFTRENMEPEAALIAAVKDKERMVVSMRKIVEFGKKNYISSYQAAADSMQNEDPEMQAYFQQYKENYEKRIADMEAVELKEESGPYGIIYSCKFPDGLLSFDFAFNDNIFILGTHYGVVTALLDEFQTSKTQKLSDSPAFKAGVPYMFENSYANTFIQTQGLWNVINYVMTGLSGGALTDQPDVEISADLERQQNAIKEQLFPFGAILRTISQLRISNAAEGPFSKSSFFIEIKELPKEEKARAEQLLEQLAQGNNSSENLPAFELPTSPVQ